MSRILVTGATGFLGAYMARRLVEDGVEVHAVARPGGRNAWRIPGLMATLHDTDLRDGEGVERLVAAIAPTAIWHLATYGAVVEQADARAIAATNFLGTVNVLEAAKSHGVGRVINTGSSSEYGPGSAPLAESQPLAPASIYGASKAGATLYVSALARAHGVQFHTLRPFSPYGPYDEPSRLIPTAIAAGLDGVSPQLASPHAVRDFIYVEDVYQAYRLATATDLPPGSVLNVGSGVQRTIGEVVAAIGHQIAGAPAPIWGSVAQRQNEPVSWVAELSQVRTLLGWQPTTGLEEGLADTINWQRSFQRSRV